MSFVTEQEKTNRTVWIVAGLVVVVLIIGAVVVLNGRNHAAADLANAQAAAAQAKARELKLSGMSLNGGVGQGSW